MALVQSGLVGGNGGYEFSHVGGTDGRVMQKIEVWAAEKCIKAISVWLSDGVEKKFGQAVKPPGEKDLSRRDFVFSPGEIVTTISLWGDTRGERSGWIFFETNQGRKFDHGMTTVVKGQEFNKDVASGIWVGIRGRANLDVDSLGVVFLKPIGSCKLFNVSYPTLQFSGSSSGVTKISKTSSIRSFKLLNPSSKDQLYWQRWGAPSRIDVPHNWTIFNPSAGLLQFFSTSTISVGARTPALTVDSNNAVGWMNSDSDIVSSTLFSSSSLFLPAWLRSGSLLPSRSVDLTCTTYQGDATSISFTGSVQFTTTSNYSFSYGGISGTFSGQSFVRQLVESN